MEKLREKGYELFVQAYEKQLAQIPIPEGLDKPVERMPEKLLKDHYDLVTIEYTKHMLKQMIKFLSVEVEEGSDGAE